MKSRKSVMDALEILSVEFLRKYTPEERATKLKAWHIGLEDITDQQIYAGINRMLKSGDEINLSVRAFRECCLASDSNLKIDAEVAWNEVKRLNPYATTIFKDSCITEAVKNIGGINKIAYMTEHEEPFVKKDFVAIYTALKKRNSNDYDNALVGMHGDSNLQFIGYKPEDTQLLEEHKAKALNYQYNVKQIAQLT